MLIPFLFQLPQLKNGIQKNGKRNPNHKGGLSLLSDLWIVSFGLLAPNVKKRENHFSFLLLGEDAVLVLYLTYGGERSCTAPKYTIVLQKDGHMNARTFGTTLFNPHLEKGKICPSIKFVG